MIFPESDQEHKFSSRIYLTDLLANLDYKTLDTCVPYVLGIQEYFFYNFWTNILFFKNPSMAVGQQIL